MVFPKKPMIKKEVRNRKSEGRRGINRNRDTKTRKVKENYMPLRRIISIRFVIPGIGSDNPVSPALPASSFSSIETF
jgi:hypothetical protein